MTLFASKVKLSTPKNLYTSSRWERSKFNIRTETIKVTGQMIMKLMKR